MYLYTALESTQNHQHVFSFEADVPSNHWLYLLDAFTTAKYQAAQLLSRLGTEFIFATWQGADQVVGCTECGEENGPELPPSLRMHLTALGSQLALHSSPVITAVGAPLSSSKLVRLHVYLLHSTQFARVPLEH
ncbi:hypothetical protein OAN61_00690 [bacterium]|nr:hypothetical protein [bacterium]